MPSPLDARFLDNLRALGLLGEPERLLVAVSGGCDSMVLLHLLRYAVPVRHALTAAHLDHAMREESAADARWVAGVCAAWEVPLLRERLREPPAGEEAARRARYAFLREAAHSAGARYVLTAHQADDQAETVLFRILRGTGLAGLAGIPARTGAGLVRPLLPFWREELEAYARSVGLRCRTDATNLVPGATRNRIRLRLLPMIEAEVAPGARRNLVALAELAHEAEAGLERLEAPAERELVRHEREAAVLARARMRDYDSGSGARVLRNVLRRFGVVLDRTGTRTALQFITDAPSGREMHLPAGVRIRLEFDEARIERARIPPRDEPLEIAAPPGVAGERGAGGARIGGCRWRVAWRAAPAPPPDEADVGGRWRVALDLASLHFPLRLRGWRPGDRMRTPGGTKALKKLFLERRVPRGERSRIPVLVDALGSVLWVCGVGRDSAHLPRPGEATLFLTVSNARLEADPGADGGA